MFDPVPFAVGGGAEHSAEVFRTMAYTATGGAEGVGEPGDLKVAALSTPGSQVRVLPGSAVIRSRAMGGAQQSYVGRNITATNVAVAATGSGSGRSDLVAVLIKDPFMPGETWPTPGDPADGPYIEAVIISNVPAGTTRLQDVTGHANTTGYAIARLDIPASTSTITEAMITDLRKLVAPRSEQQVFTAASVGNGGPWVNGEIGPDPLQASDWQAWPSVANWQVKVPDWATRVTIVGTIAGANERVSDAWGNLRMKFGSQISGTVGYDYTYPASPSRVSFTLAETFDIAPADRGTTKTVKFEGMRVGGSGVLGAYHGTVSAIQVYFEERAV